MLDPTTGLPAVLTTGAVSAAVSALLSLFAPLLAQVPGLRASDASRNPLLRALVFVLTLAGLVGLAWSQGVALPQVMWPALALYAAGGAGFAHLLYVGAKTAASTNTGPQASVVTLGPATVGTTAQFTAIPFTDPDAPITQASDSPAPAPDAPTAS